MTSPDEAPTPSILAAPSILYPIAGGLLGFLLASYSKESTGGEKVWATAFGLTFGALYNASSTAVVLETKVAQAKNIELRDTNIGIAARSFLGQGVADPLKDRSNPYST